MSRASIARNSTSRPSSEQGSHPSSSRSARPSQPNATAKRLRMALSKTRSMAKPAARRSWPPAMHSANARWRNSMLASHSPTHTAAFAARSRSSRSSDAACVGEPVLLEGGDPIAALERRPSIGQHLIAAHSRPSSTLSSSRSEEDLARRTSNASRPRPIGENRAPRRASAIIKRNDTYRDGRYGTSSAGSNSAAKVVERSGRRSDNRSAVRRGATEKKDGRACGRQWR